MTGTAFNSSSSPLIVPVGECSGPIPVSPSSGTATIVELPTPGIAVSAITTDGYGPPPLSEQLGNALRESFDTQRRTATVVVNTPATAGDTSLETIVTLTNYEAPPAQLKLCKIAGPGIGANTPPFNFTVAPSTAAVPPLQAGPLAEGGYCVLENGTFQVGTSVLVTETVPGNDGVPTITVNGQSATPNAGCRLSLIPLPFFPCSVSALIGPGINEVSFTNCAVQSCTAQPQQSQNGLPSLAIVNYSLVSQVAATGSRSYMTYRADLLNPSPAAIGPIVATLTSLDPSSIQVVGQGALNFAPVQANGQVASSNTFTILTNPTVPLDSSKLNWTYHSRRNMPPTRHHLPGEGERR